MLEVMLSDRVPLEVEEPVLVVRGVDFQEDVDAEEQEDREVEVLGQLRCEADLDRDPINQEHDEGEVNGVPDDLIAPEWADDREPVNGVPQQGQDPEGSRCPALRALEEEGRLVVYEADVELRETFGQQLLFKLRDELPEDWDQEIVVLFVFLAVDGWDRTAGDVERGQLVACVLAVFQFCLL